MRGSALTGMVRGSNWGSGMILIVAYSASKYQHIVTHFKTHFSTALSFCKMTLPLQHLVVGVKSLSLNVFSQEEGVEMRNERKNN